MLKIAQILLRGLSGYIHRTAQGAHAHHFISDEQFKAMRHAAWRLLAAAEGKSYIQYLRHIAALGLIDAQKRAIKNIRHRYGREGIRTIFHR